jgi:hypothetical protein
MTVTTKSSYCHTMIPGKDEVVSMHEGNVSTAKTPTSKYEEGTKRNTPRAEQTSPTPEMISSMAPSEGIAHRCSDLLSERSAAKSIKRSFDILSKMDLSVDHTCHNSSEFCSGWGLYDREWSEEEKDELVAFANKHIIRGCGDKNDPHEDNGGRSKKGKTTQVVGSINSNSSFMPLS